MSEPDPFNCPKCGSHDYGLYAAGLLPCPHCQAADLRASKAEVERLAAFAERLLVVHEDRPPELARAIVGQVRRALSGEE